MSSRRPYTIVFVLLLAFAQSGCLALSELWQREPVTETGDSGAPEEVPQGLRWEPTALDYGRVALDSTAWATLTLSNEGSEVVRLMDVALESENTPFTLGSLDAVLLEPDEAVAFQVYFSPWEVGDIAAWLLVETDDWIAGQITVPLTGEGVGPELAVDEGSLALGEVHVGCTAEADLVVQNTGLVELEVESIEVVGESTYLTMVIDGVAGPPWRVPPGESWSLGRVGFTPLEEISESLAITLRSNDPALPAVTFAATAEGSYQQEVTEVFGSGNLSMDLIFAIDSSGSMWDELELLVEVFPVLFAELVSQGLDFRLAAVLADDGCVAGDWIWLGSVMDEEDAAAAFATMVAVEDPAANSLAEAGFSLLEAAIGQLGVGECNEDLVRDDATLHLVGVSDEREQSAHDYPYYLSVFQNLKEGRGDVYVDAIGGEYPLGCSDAEPYEGFWEATHATGGVFMSICPTDWETEMQAFAEGLVALTGLNTTFELADVPVESTLVVEVGGEPSESGWSYDAADNTVAFEDGVIVEQGVEIRISYAVTGDCE